MKEWGKWWCWVIVFVFLSASVYGDNPIQIENREKGTTDWQLTNPAVNGEIEGYASAMSVNLGERIKLLVNTAEVSYQIELFRFGYYHGQGGRKMLGPIIRRGKAQPLPVPDPNTGLSECDWMEPYTLTIAPDWTSGIYLVKLTARASRREAYIIFVVRDDARPADFLYQASVTTWQAYNYWGGHSLYGYSSSQNHRAYKVSFDRPFAPPLNPTAAGGTGAGEFFSNYAPPGARYRPIGELSAAGWECNMVLWLEREGYDVTYATNLDVHRDPQLLIRHRGFLSVGHDEYWSRPMRDNVEAALAAGVNLGFFSANTCYWQIRLRPAKDGTPDRTMVCYKASKLDPFSRRRSLRHLVTITWRALGFPEDMLLGVMHNELNPVDGDIIINRAEHWVFAGTDRRNGDRLAGLLGYETDALGWSTPPGTVVLGHSPFSIQAIDETLTYRSVAQMTIYSAPSQALVFATGSIQWSWGLDDYNAPLLRSARSDPNAQQITRNILRRFARGSLFAGAAPEP